MLKICMQGWWKYFDNIKPLFPQEEVPSDENAPGPSTLRNIMRKTIKEKRASLGSEIDCHRRTANKALDQYLALPNAENTMLFWKNHSITTDMAQEHLCELARVYLTPPPTSTGMLDNYFCTLVSCIQFTFCYRCWKAVLHGGYGMNT